MSERKQHGFLRVLVLMIVAFLGVSGYQDSFKTPQIIETPTELNEVFDLVGPGQMLLTHIYCPENGNIAIRVDLPQNARYGQSAPIVVVASTWFVEKYTQEEVGFHLVYNPADIGAITVTHLWPGKVDPETKIRSDGVYDFGGPDSIAALRDTIRFALGDIPNISGRYLHELIEIKPLYENVGLFASSHAGVVATNVMAYHGNHFLT